MFYVSSCFRCSPFVFFFVFPCFSFGHFLCSFVRAYFGQSCPRIRGDLRQFGGQIWSQTGPKTSRRRKQNPFSRGTPNKHNSLKHEVNKIMSKPFFQIPCTCFGLSLTKSDASDLPKTKNKKNNSKNFIFVTFEVNFRPPGISSRLHGAFLT